MKTLLEKALLSTPRKISEITSEQVELALAWADDKVSYAQVTIALGRKPKGSHTYILLARALKKAFQDSLKNKII